MRIHGDTEWTHFDEDFGKLKMMRAEEREEDKQEGCAEAGLERNSV